ncbi:MAG: SpoIID/LytB domain-containing protein [Vicinamibacterales bacterium]
MELPLEEYVARVLAGEGEPQAGAAAQEALAIAIRTFVKANPNRHRADGFDVCDSTHCQVPRAATAATRRAAQATAGQILLYNGRPAEVFYSASCGGHSESASEVWPGADYPYLQSVEDDVHDGDVPWTVTLTRREVEAALRRAGFEGSLSRVDIGARNRSGRVAVLRLNGLTPALVAGEQFRTVLGAVRLRSTAFTLTTDGDTIEFAGRGFGHGVGMCVIGAGRRAARGETARDILGQYFPGLTLTGSAPVLTRRPPGATPPATPPATVAEAPPAVLPRRPAAPAVRPAGTEVDQLAARAQAELSRTLGVRAAAAAVTVHPSLDAFRLATGQPWWVGRVAQGGSIHLAPLPVLAQTDGLERTVRMAVVEMLTGGALAERPAWVRVGAARYYSQPAPAAAPSGRPRCPADAELSLAISAAARRDAEARAEACFARAIAQTGDWRAIR